MRCGQRIVYTALSPRSFGKVPQIGICPRCRHGLFSARLNEHAAAAGAALSHGATEGTPRAVVGGRRTAR